MIHTDSFNTLRQRIPDCKYVDRIAELDVIAASLPFETFREPVAINELNDSGNNRILNLDADYLKAWAAHMSYSMRVRLRTLEPGIVDALARGRALAAQVLLRSHLEATAMSALCLETLMRSDHESLAKLVPQTLFGTALFNRSKRDEMIAEMLTYSEQRTITISHAMAALHRFAFPEGGPDSTGVAYGLLCESSHPNHRGTKLFVSTEDVDSTGEHGWYISYSEIEKVPNELTKKLIEVLLFSMAYGYAATELLRHMKLSNSGDHIKVHGVSEEAGKKIWFEILQKAI